MRDVVSSLTATALIQASNIVSGVLLARFLQPDGRGELAAVMLWPIIIAGLGISGLHEAIAYHAARRRHGAKIILKSGLLLGAVLSLVLLPIGAVIAEVVFDDKSAQARQAALLYLAFIPLNFLGMFLVALFQGALRFFEWNLLRTSVHVFYLLFIPLFYLMGMGGVLGFALASLLSNVAMICLAIALYRRTAWHESDQGGLPSSALRSLTNYGLSVHVGAAIAIIAERLDQMIISVLLPAADLGLYVIALTLSRLPLLLSSTLATVSFPKIASLSGEAERAEIFGRYVRVTTFVVVGAALALAAMIPWLLPFFFGTAFAAATPVALVLTVAAVPISLKAMMSAGLKACDRGLIVGQAEFLTLGLSAAALAVLVPAYGLIGAAIAGVIAQGAGLGFMVVRTHRALGIAPGHLLILRRADFVLVLEMAHELRRRATG